LPFKAPPPPSAPRGTLTETRTCVAPSEAAFSELGKQGLAAALLAAKQAADPAGFSSFQATVASLKLRRARLEADLASIEAALEAGRARSRADARRASDAAAAGPAAAARPLPAPASLVLLAGFESFNARLYERAAADAAAARPGLSVAVFSEGDIFGPRAAELEQALLSADAVVCSLLFDYDQVEWVTERTQGATVRINFECALELMATTRVGAFRMAPSGKSAGPPPAVKKVLALFGSGREEDRMVGYLSFLKIGPSLLKFVPGRKAADLRTWLTSYAYWNAGGRENVAFMLTYLADECLSGGGAGERAPTRLFDLAPSPPPPPPVVETPQTGCVHPARPGHVFATAGEYLDWRVSSGRAAATPPSAPVVALLLYRKHVITELPYIPQLIEMLEEEGIVPVPIFINGVEAHAVVRDSLTSTAELEAGNAPPNATRVDAIVSTIGFPLVGGPAGTMEGGRQSEIAAAILTSKDVPYIVAAPLLIQDVRDWARDGVGGLQSVVLYALPELDGAIDAVPLGGLIAGDIYLVGERVKALAARVKGWVTLRATPARDRRVAALTYGFPPGVGATGTAALLNVPKSLDALVAAMDGAGYDLGPGPATGSSWEGVGDAVVSALTAQLAPAALSRGAAGLHALGVGAAADYGAAPACADVSVAQLKEWLTFPSRWGPTEWGPIPFLPEPDVLVARMEANWALGSPTNIAHSSSGAAVVPGLALGNLWLGVQPLLGVEGDPMRLLFERDLTPHPQYAALYKWLQRGDRAPHALVHFGMHGTVEWLPGAPLGNTGLSWPDVLLGGIPNVYLYACNNPSESIVAKRRGYGTIVSYNVPPYGRAGLYKALAGLRGALADWREAGGGDGREGGAAEAATRGAVADLVSAAGLASDVPFSEDLATLDAETVADVDAESFAAWAGRLTTYLSVLEARLYSSGLHVLGSPPDEASLTGYMDALYGCGEGGGTRGRLPAAALAAVAAGARADDVVGLALADAPDDAARALLTSTAAEAVDVRSRLAKTGGELDATLAALSGRYIAAAPGGDLLRDGPGALPTGRNIHALDPYRMPSAAAMARGARAADQIVSAHQAQNNGAFPETVAVNLWGLDAIKTKGESVAIVLRLVGAAPVAEATGRVARFALTPLADLGRPRIDVLANVSGIFRDSFQNVLDLLDALFEAAATADEPAALNFVRKHADAATAAGIARPSSRLFSNPAGDYGSMVGERVGASDWGSGSDLGDTWASRNAASYGRGGERGAPRPDLLKSLLATTDRVVQTVDSVEYGLTDIQEYYANTGALARAAADARADAAGVARSEAAPASVSIVEAFGDAPPKDLDAVLRLEYRSKLLNPRWAAAMVAQGSGGAFEVSQRVTALLGWGATTDFKEDWAWDQTVETYVDDDGVREALVKANPEAFRNIVRRALEAAGRGLWNADDATLARLRAAYSDVDDKLEGVA
jgi:magnesium chelatase subunit H